MAIRRTFAEDLYVVLARYDVAQQSAEVEVVVNPLVNWVWFGFGILAWGTLIALLPDSAFRVRGRPGARACGHGRACSCWRSR